MVPKLDQAVAKLEALKEGLKRSEHYEAAPQPAAAAPAEAPREEAPEEEASLSKEVEEARKVMEMHRWAADALAAKGSAAAGAMLEKAEESRKFYESLQATQRNNMPR